MKPYFLTMVYNNADIFRSGIHSLYSTAELELTGFSHVLLDQHYPLKYEDVLAAIYEYRRSVHTDIVTLDAGKNLGLHDGLTYMFEYLKPVLQPDDILIAFDIDEHPWTPGWADAMLRVFAADPKCGWLSLQSPPAKDHLDANAVPVRVVGGENVRIPNYPLINTLCAWRVEAIRAIGSKFTEPYTWYGGIECDMMPKFTEAGYWVGWMADYGVSPERALEDPLYREWKDRHVGHRTPMYDGSFEEFVQEQSK